MKNLVCIILARKGSKRIKNKNLLKINNKTLVEWTINFAKKICLRKNIIFSTDSKKMRKISIKLGINTPWLRPKEISTTKSSSFDAANHAIKWFEKNNSKIDFIVLLQPTSPFRSVSDFKRAFKKFKENTKMPLISVKKINLTSDKFLKKTKKFIESYNKKRQETIYIPNGSFFIIKKDILLKNRNFISEKMNFFEETDLLKNTDIDTLNDYKLAKVLYSNKL